MLQYTTLAAWWPLLSAPAEYAEEAALYWQAITEEKSIIYSALELGAGGGNNAYHLKHYADWTLTDLSAPMLEVSEALNPECQHRVGDMRHLDLGRTFDLVFIQDAIMFMTTQHDLLAVFRTARRHLSATGLLFIAPDFTQETFRPSTSSGGHDAQDRALRYLEWCYDPDPLDERVTTTYTYLLREGAAPPHSETETVEIGLFSRATWQRLLAEAGFSSRFVALPHSELPPDSYYGIVARPIGEVRTRLRWASGSGHPPSRPE